MFLSLNKHGISFPSVKCFTRFILRELSIKNDPISSMLFFEILTCFKLMSGKLSGSMHVQKSLTALEEKTKPVHLTTQFVKFFVVPRSEVIKRRREP